MYWDRCQSGWEATRSYDREIAAKRSDDIVPKKRWRRLKPNIPSKVTKAPRKFREG